MEIGLDAAKEWSVETKLAEQNPLLFFEGDDQALLRKKIRSSKTPNSKESILEQDANNEGMSPKQNLGALSQKSPVERNLIGHQPAYWTQRHNGQTFGKTPGSDGNSTLLQTNKSGVEPTSSQLATAAGSFTDEDANYNVRDTGNIGIDALLTGRKWNDKILTYSFYDGGSYYASNTGLSEVSDVIKSYVRHILEDLIEPLVNLDFVEVSDAGGNYGQIRYMFEEASPTAHAYYPSNVKRGGDVLLGTKNKKYFEMGPGSFRYETLIHETMHAIGLKHPGDYNGTGSGDPPFLPYNEDNRTNALMSYNSSGMNGSYYRGITPMTYDIRALQYLYGAKAHQAGDTTYKFDTVYGYTVNGEFFGSHDGAIKQTIWDSKGLDTVDFSGLASNSSGYRFDLNDGGWLTTQKAYNGASYRARSDKSGKNYYTTAYGTALAYDVTVENVINSSSDDLMILNQAANTISGYTVGKQVGDDVIVDANSKDTLDLSDYKASAVTKSYLGDDLVLNLGGDGSVTIKGYRTTSTDNRINILLDGATSSPVEPPVDPPTSTTLQTSFQQGLNGYTGAADTYIHDGSTTSHASVTSLNVDASDHSGSVQSLLRFDNLFGDGTGQIASNAKILSASLEFHVTNPGDHIEFHRMLQDWSDTATWYSLGNGIQTNGTEAAFTADAVTSAVSVGTLSVDVTNSLQTWLAVPSSNYGWAITPTGNNGVDFSSSEGVVAPRLVVKYSVPPAPAPVSQTLIGENIADQLEGAAGDDIIKGRGGKDILMGKEGRDKIWGGSGNDTLNGDDGNDILRGGGGKDIITGGDGNDIIDGGDGLDILTGGAGADRFLYTRVNKHNKGDTITDFEVGVDKFNLKDIFSDAKYGAADVFGNYIQVVGSGTDAQVKVDTLGDTGDQFKTLATLTGIDANSLTAKHFIVQ